MSYMLNLAVASTFVCVSSAVGEIEGPRAVDPLAGTLDPAWGEWSPGGMFDPFVLMSQTEDEVAEDFINGTYSADDNEGIDYDKDGDVDTGDLARAAQNPVADLISLPFQNNVSFPVGPGDNAIYNLNIQPVIPVDLNDDWLLITRTILPVLYVPSVAKGVSSEAGVGDLQFTGFFSPRDSEVIWGVGPAFRFPTASNDALGSEKYSAGPSGVVLIMEGPWVYGALIQNLWSFSGESDREDVNDFLLQPFVNYNLDGGWYLTSSPIITANWEANSDNRWVVPVGGGVGKISRIGTQPINTSLQAFYNVETTELGPDWTIRFQFQLLFPR